MAEPLPLTAGATLVLRLPEGAVRELDEDLPSLAVPSLPGARIVVRRGYRSPDLLTLRIACMAAPADGWAPGVEEIVLDRATQIARDTLGDGVLSLSAGERTHAGSGFEQRFEGVLGMGDTFTFRGRHWLGFAGDPREAIVCTAVCTEVQGLRSGACDGLVEAATTAGTWAEAPPPSLLVRTLLFAAEHPHGALAALVAFSLAAAAWIVAKRPRPRA